MAQQLDRGELLPIGEFSRRSSLSIYQLRHYHEVGLLEPRHVDSETETLARAGVSRTEALAPAPDWRTQVRVIGEGGGELATVDAFEEPEPGFRLSVEFELTEVEPLEERGYRATARPLPPSRPGVVYRPSPPVPAQEG